MKQVSALELRRDLKGHTDEVRRTGEPTTLVLHGEKVVAMVPVEWAKVIDQVNQFDRCDANHEELKVEIRQVIVHAFAQASAKQSLSLAEIFQKIAEDATTVRQFHSLRGSMK